MNENYDFLAEKVGAMIGLKKTSLPCNTPQGEWWSISSKLIKNKKVPGRRLEDYISDVLEHLAVCGEISSFIYHKPFSLEDISGKDFTVSRITQAGTRTYSFGITTSKVSRKRSRKKHPGVEIIYIDAGLNGHDIVKIFTDLWDKQDRL